MKFIAILLTSIFLYTGLLAQQTHFIYIQTNNKQQFYVNLDKKIYSSNASGYLILPKLTDGTYNFIIGFPKNQWAQQKFSSVIDQKDIGYVLTNFGEKGWGLFNLQTMQVTMASGASTANGIATEERTDSFSNMLSAVVNDPSIKQKTITKPEVKMDTVQVAPVQKTEVVAVNDNNIAINETPVSRSIITKILEISNTAGTEAVYVIKDGDQQDTVRILIPAEKIVQDHVTVDSQKITPDVPKEEPVVQTKPVTVITAPVDTAIVAQPSQATTPTITKTNDSPQGVQNLTITTVSKNDCKSIATDDDFLKLRKKMAAADNDDDMMNMAKKVFKTKCFKTDQIKNLGFLFLNDQGKYQFFAIAYSFVSDPENYNTLESQLTDTNYINRFKAMISH